MAINENATITLTMLANDLASGKVGAFAGKLDALAKRGGLVGNVIQGVGLSFGTMLNPVALAGNAIGAVTDLLGDAISSAQEEETSLARLDQALANNVDGWNGNRAAIDEAIDGRMKLGFADESLRDSLGKLVVRTHDSTEALDLQRIAMDLARAKQMDLAAATDLVGKAYSGQVGALRRAGIAIDSNATATEALAALQETYGGTAQRFADTTEGAMLRANIAIDEAVESLGIALLPVMENVANAMTAAIGQVDAFATHWHNFERLVQPGVAEIQDAFVAMSAETGYSLAQLDAGFKFVGGRAVQSMDEFRAWKDSVIYNLQQTGTVAANDLPEGFEAGGERVQSTLLDIRRGVHQNRVRVVNETEQMIVDMTEAVTQGISPLRDRFDQIKKIMDPDWINKNRQRTVRLLRQLNRQREQAIADGNDEAVVLLDQLIADVESRMSYLDALDATTTFTIAARWRNQRRAGWGEFSQGGTRRAYGGPAEAYEPIIVGEMGQEMFVPKTDGYIVPHAPTMAMLGKSKGRNGGVMPFVYAPMFSTASPAEARRLAEYLRPHLQAADVRSRRQLDRF